MADAPPSGWTRVAATLQIGERVVCCNKEHIPTRSHIGMSTEKRRRVESTDTHLLSSSQVFHNNVPFWDQFLLCFRSNSVSRGGRLFVLVCCPDRVDHLCFLSLWTGSARRCSGLCRNGAHFWIEQYCILGISEKVTEEVVARAIASPSSFVVTV